MKYRYKLHQYDNIHRIEIEHMLNYVARDGGRVIAFDCGPNGRLDIYAEYEIQTPLHDRRTEK